MPCDPGSTVSFDKTPQRRDSDAWVRVRGRRGALRRCSFTRRLTFAPRREHPDAEVCALPNPRRFMVTDRVTSRGPNAFNYNTLLPNKSRVLLRLRPALRDGVQFSRP